MYVAGQNVGPATVANDLGAAKPLVMGNNYDAQWIYWKHR